jgi:hypothetical protein
MITLAEWLRPLIEARKARAEKATQGEWDLDGGSITNGHPVDQIVDWVYERADGEHIVENQPRQIIADCEYQLAELARHDRTHRCDWGDYHTPDRPCTPLKRLARIYRHRDPDGYADLAEDWEP